MKIGKPKYEKNTFRPWGTPKDPPWGLWKKLFSIPYASDVTLTILNEKLNEMQKHKYERNPFCPWGTPKDPPLGIGTKLFQNQNVSDINPSKCHMNMREKKEKLKSNKSYSTLNPWGTEYCPPGVHGVNFFKSQMWQI